MDIKTSYSSFDQAFDFMESKIRQCPNFVELPDFLSPFQTLTNGFKPGEITLVKGSKCDELFTSLLHAFVTNNIFTYIISKRYSECYIGLNLLKYGLGKSKRNPRNLQCLYSGWFEQNDLEELKKEYEKELPFVTSQFSEYNIDEICDSIRTFAQGYNQDLDSKKILILRDIAFEDLKKLKTLAEVFNFPVIVFMPTEGQNSPYVACEINIAKPQNIAEPSLSKTQVYSINIKNFITLQEGEGELYFDTSLSAFIPNEETKENAPVITQEVIDKIS